MTSFSRRTEVDGGLNALARVLARVRASGRPVLDLTESNPTRAGFEYPIEVVQSAFGDERLCRYAPDAFGLLSAREAVAHDWAGRGHAIDASRILLTASTSEAYSLVFKLLCDPGDEVLVPSPSYPLFDELARYEGVEVARYRLAYDGAWHVDLESVRRARTARTRAVLIVSPNNPTGSFVSAAELASLSELGLPLVSDEVFAAYPLADAIGPSAVIAGRTVPVFVLGGLSKQAALPGMKLAWTTIAGPDALVAEALARLDHLADAYLSPGTPVQLALPTLLAATRTLRQSIRQRAARNLECLRAVCQGTPASVLEPDAGWYAVVRLPATRSEEAWVVGLLEERGVLTHPGWFYGFEMDPVVVLGLIAPESTFDEGARHLVEHVGAG